MLQQVVSKNRSKVQQLQEQLDQARSELGQIYNANELPNPFSSAAIILNNTSSLSLGLVRL